MANGTATGGCLGLPPGPSGAATLAGIRMTLADPVSRAALELPADAVIVLLSHEGDYYREVVTESLAEE